MIREPESMEELVYHTNRTLGPAQEGSIRVWVYKKQCPECKKGLMSKPRDDKTGRYKTRAPEYVCEECGYTVAKADYEPTLEYQASYTCHECGKEGTGEGPYKRKTVEGVKTLQIICEHCGGKLNVTKKMKDFKKKKKKGKAPVDLEDE